MNDLIAVVAEMTGTQDTGDGGKFATIKLTREAWAALNRGMVNTGSLKIAVCPLRNNQAAEAEERRRRRFGRLMSHSDVWTKREWCEALGTDKEFQQYAKIGGCVEGAISWGTCRGDVVFAHCRRVSRGSGVGIKPKFSGIGLCDHHHRQQHQYGEHSLLCDMEQQSHNILRAWAELKFCETFRAKRLQDICPDDVCAWAATKNVMHLLPEAVVKLSKWGSA